MGMFDDIIVPKSYLKSLLTKDQERLVVDNDYQTKSLENFLAQYKIHRQKLYIKKDGFKKGGKWTLVKDYTGEVIFYTSFLSLKIWIVYHFSLKAAQQIKGSSGGKKKGGHFTTQQNSAHFGERASCLDLFANRRPLGL